MLVCRWQEARATTGSFVSRGFRISPERDAVRIRKRGGQQPLRSACMDDAGTLAMANTTSVCGRARTCFRATVFFECAADGSSFGAPHGDHCYLVT